LKWPSGLKSSTQNIIAEPLYKIEKEWRVQFAKDLAKWKDDNPNPREADDENKPKLKRLIINDATYEKLQVILSENPRGLIVLRDELAGLLEIFERKGHEGERPFYLTAWNGDSPYGMDRIERGSIPLEYVCLSLFGGIQPLRLRQHLATLNENSTLNDGLIQRLQILVWPDLPPWNYTDRKPNSAAQAQMQRIYNQILKLEPPEPIRYRFSPDAQDQFVAWLELLETRLRTDDLNPGLLAHLSKYRGLMPSLAHQNRMKTSRQRRVCNA
jgi:hypothetical protein